MPTSTNEKLPQVRGIPDAIATAVSSGIDSANIFKNLDEHMLDTPVNDNHTFSLIKTISQCYGEVRFTTLEKKPQKNLIEIKLGRS